MLINSTEKRDGTAPEAATLSLNLLGPFELRRERDQAIKLPKKAQGLLSFLAASRGTSYPRDHLATLLWGDTATEQARQSLRQCLAAIRGGLGDAHGDLLCASPADISLSASRSVMLDTEAFIALSRSAQIDDLNRASTLYRDELLAGLQIAVEPFERWLAIERQRLFAMRIDVQQRLAIAEREAGRIDDAIRSARALVELDSLSEQSHRLLMRLLAEGGQRAAALKKYEQCVGILRQELDIAPETETTHLADAIRSGGIGVHAIPASVPEPGASAEHGADGATASPDKPSIVVLPFANLSGDATRDYFVRGLVDDITVALGRESWLFVIDGSSAHAFKDRSADSHEIGAKFGVRYVLKGSVRIEGGEVVLVVQLSDVARGAHVWSQRFQDKLDNALALQERLTARLAAMIGPALKAVEVDRALHKPTRNASAFDLYLRALPKFRSSRADNEAALALLRDAVALDPDYASAYALAARCYQFQIMYNWRAPDDPGLLEGARLAHRAIETGRNDSEALWMAGLALVHITGEHDLVLGQIERSLSLNPNAANAWIAGCFVHSYLGNTQLAREHFDQAQRLNPLDVSQHLHWNAVAWAFLGGGHIEDAHDAAMRTLRIDPIYPPALRMKISTCGLLGRIEEARDPIARLLASRPGSSVSWQAQALRAPLQHNPKALATMLTGLRLAGLPER
jgi:TolB-like protein